MHMTLPTYHCSPSFTDLLGSVAFTPVKSDMLGNIKKIRDRQLASPTTSESLQSLVRSELSTKSHIATEGLLWLTRGLDFTAQALRHDLTNNASQPAGTAKPSLELADCFRAGYKTSLAPHHGWMIKPIFSAAMSATPYRKDFYSKMVNGQTGNEEKARQAMEQWVGALERRVGILKAFLASKEAKW